jgi:hypothetical protein
MNVIFRKNPDEAGFAAKKLLRERIMAQNDTKTGKIKIIQKNQEEKYKDSREEKLDRPKTIFQNWKKL